MLFKEDKYEEELREIRLAVLELIDIVKADKTLSNQLSDFRARWGHLFTD